MDNISYFPGEKTIETASCRLFSRYVSYDIEGTIFLTSMNNIYLSYSAPHSKEKKNLNWKLDSIIDIEIINSSHPHLYLRFDKESCAVPEFNLYVDEIDKWNSILKKEKIKYGYYSNSFTSDIALLLKTQSETYFDEIIEIALNSYGYEGFTDKDVIKILRNMITDLEDIEGFIEKDKRRFIHKAKFERMRENININTNFDIKKNATIVIKCPYCGAPTPDSLSSPNVVCPSCSGSYMVPKRLFDIL